MTVFEYLALSLLAFIAAGQQEQMECRWLAFGFMLSGTAMTFAALLEKINP